jgi:GTPase SAR1 family protein
MPRTAPAPAVASPSNPTLFEPLIRTAIVGAYGIGKTSLIQSFIAPNGNSTL